MIGITLQLCKMNLLVLSQTLNINKTDLIFIYKKNTDKSCQLAKLEKLLTITEIGLD